MMFVGILSNFVICVGVEIKVYEDLVSGLCFVFLKCSVFIIKLVFFFVQKTKYN